MYTVQLAWEFTTSRFIIFWSCNGARIRPCGIIWFIIINDDLRDSRIWLKSDQPTHEDELIRNDMIRIDEVIIGEESLGFQEPQSDHDPFESSSDEEPPESGSTSYDTSVVLDSTLANPVTTIQSAWFACSMQLIMCCSDGLGVTMSTCIICHITLPWMPQITFKRLVNADVQ